MLDIKKRPEKSHQNWPLQAVVAFGNQKRTLLEKLSKETVQEESSLFD